MKDAYSFDVDEDGLDLSYRKMSDAYREIFTRCGLEFSVVDADSGAIGGSQSQEFVVSAETGEDVFSGLPGYGLCRQPRGGRFRVFLRPSQKIHLQWKRSHTPGATKLTQLATFFPEHPQEKFAKTIIYKATHGDRYALVAVLIRGDQEVNEVKLKNELKALAVVLASDEDVKRGHRC